MFEKYLNGVIEQVFRRVSIEEKNIAMACYNNIFSMEGLETIKRYSQMDNVFFAWKEYSLENVVGAYDPFLDIICEMYRAYIHEDFNEFLNECQVYELHRDILNCYYETGICQRKEDVLLDEVEYEQDRMVKTIYCMLKKVAEYKPVMLVINRFQMASRSTMKLVQHLVEEPVSNIGIVLGVNEARIPKDNRIKIWQKLSEILGDWGQIYHVGRSSQKGKREYSQSVGKKVDYEKLFTQLNNVIELLDFYQANEYLLNMERRIKFDEVSIPDTVKLSLYFMHTKVSILMGDMSKALDIIEDILRLKVPEQEERINYQCSMDSAACYMYLGKLDLAYHHAENAKTFAELLGQEKLVFLAEVLMLRAKMAGWHNIFFCVTDIQADAALIEKLMHYQYRNHLAHVYIYGYDNKPEVVMKAYRSESALVHFSRGIKLAKEIGNELLVCNAYQKNAMIASTNGLNEIALLYSLRTYQFIQDHKSLEAGRMLSAIGYNLSALGHMEESKEFYERAIRLFYDLQLPEEIAEVCYNASLTCFAQGKYKEAEFALKLATKTIDKLHLNSLRVCNLAKLYALHSIYSTLQWNLFDGERYLLNCAQFMNYLIIKQDEEAVHDFARSDDDVCLYYFAKALQEAMDGDYAAAFESLERTEKYFQLAEGNLFYIHEVYYRVRMEVFEKMGRVELFKNEQLSLLQYEEAMIQISAGLSEKLLTEVGQSLKKYESVITEQIEGLIRQESLLKENKQKKRQLDFISEWQNMLDKSNVRAYELVKSSIRLFLNQFNNDCALYVRYDNNKANVLYNDTGVFISAQKQKELETHLALYPDGVAVSKITHTFYEHSDIIDMFDADEVCSLVAVPFFKNGKLESFFITYIKMKENWHDSVNRYLLNEDDLRIYQLLFRELGHAIHRIESYDKIYRMNKRLQEAATTDVLTGLTNRMGMYEKVQNLLKKREKEKKIQGLCVMFLDLDNFKPYNDTYGHEVGDIVLRGMAKIFSAAVKDKGFVVRYGGDEFIIITYIHDRDELEAIAKDIYVRIQAANGFMESIRKVLGRDIVINEKDKISCSIGIMQAESFTHEAQLDEMIKKADDSLYSVKASGKGKYIFV